MFEVQEDWSMVFWIGAIANFTASAIAMLVLKRMPLPKPRIAPHMIPDHGNSRPRPMTRAPAVLTFLLINAFLPPCALSHDHVAAVLAGPDGTAQITFGGGHRISIPKEGGQVGIGDAQIASDGTVGWLAEFRVEGVSYPIAGTLVIWREGKILRRFHTEQSFYSWTFKAGGKQVAYHTGPLHGEVQAHCELRDVVSGRLIAVWNGDLEGGSGRPGWIEGLTH